MVRFAGYQTRQGWLSRTLTLPIEFDGAIDRVGVHRRPGAAVNPLPLACC
jgi:hypothetical protein